MFSSKKDRYPVYIMTCKYYNKMLLGCKGGNLILRLILFFNSQMYEPGTDLTVDWYSIS